MTTSQIVTLVIAVIGVLHGPAIPAIIKWWTGRKAKP